MGPLHPNLVPGTASSRAEHKADLGKLIIYNGNLWRLVKAGIAMNPPNSATNYAGGCFVRSAYNGTTILAGAGVPSWIVKPPGTAVSATGVGGQNGAVIVGLVPIGQTNSLGAQGLLLNDYFYVQVTGPARAFAFKATLIKAVRSLFKPLRPYTGTTASLTLTSLLNGLLAPSSLLLLTSFSLNVNQVGLMVAVPTSSLVGIRISLSKVSLTKASLASTQPAYLGTPIYLHGLL